jgi:hypothetical protein
MQANQYFFLLMIEKCYRQIENRVIILSLYHASKISEKKSGFGGRVAWLNILMSNFYTLKTPLTFRVRRIPLNVCLLYPAPFHAIKINITLKYFLCQKLRGIVMQKRMISVAVGSEQNETQNKCFLLCLGKPCTLYDAAYIYNSQAVGF